MFKIPKKKINKEHTNTNGEVKTNFKHLLISRSWTGEESLDVLNHN